MQEVPAQYSVCDPERDTDYWKRPLFYIDDLETLFEASKSRWRSELFTELFGTHPDRGVVWMSLVFPDSKSAEFDIPSLLEGLGCLGVPVELTYWETTTGLNLEGEPWAQVFERKISVNDDNLSGYSIRVSLFTLEFFGYVRPSAPTKEWGVLLGGMQICFAEYTSASTINEILGAGVAVTHIRDDPDHVIVVRGPERQAYPVAWVGY